VSRLLHTGNAEHLFTLLRLIFCRHMSEIHTVMSSIHMPTNLHNGYHCTGIFSLRRNISRISKKRLSENRLFTGKSDLGVDYSVLSTEQNIYWKIWSAIEPAFPYNPPIWQISLAIEPDLLHRHSIRKPKGDKPWSASDLSCQNIAFFYYIYIYIFFSLLFYIFH